jgi:guanidinobutyrase
LRTSANVPINPFDLKDSIQIIEAYYDSVLLTGTKPLSLGGDHTIALPILRALARKHG